MKVFAVLLTLLLGAGFIAGAIYLSQTQNQATNAEGKHPTTVGDLAAKEPPIPVIAAKGPYPKVVVPEREYNFGIMQVHDHGSHQFIVRNEGEAPLELVVRESDTSCQCTVGKLADTDGKLQPGEETTVELKWEVKKFVDAFRHSAKIRTNDPQNPTIDMAITGVIDKKYHLVPEALWDLGEISGDQPQTASGQLYSRMADAFEVAEVVSTNPRMQFTWTPMDGNDLNLHSAKSGYKLNLTLDVKDLSGSFREQVQVKVKDEKEPAAIIEVRTKKPGPFWITGPRWDNEQMMIHLGEFPAGEGRAVELSFFVQLNDAVELLSAEAEHKSVNVTWKKSESFQATGNRSRYILRVEVPKGAAINRQQGAAEKVRLKFSRPELGEMTIRVGYLSL